MALMLIKSAPVGVLAAVCGIVACVVGSMVLMQGIAVTGAGGHGAVSFGISPGAVLLVTLTFFLLGSTWMYTRLRRRQGQVKARAVE
jgi:hypothetical protein